MEIYNICVGKHTLSFALSEYALEPSPRRATDTGRPTDRRTNRQTDVWMNGKIDRQTDRQTYRPTNRQTVRQPDGLCSLWQYS